MLSIGAALFPTEAPTKALQFADLAASLEYQSLWLGDSQLIWHEAFVLLGAIAARLPRFPLATGVTNPVMRDVTVLASASATLQRLTEGHFSLGIGKGDSSVMTARQSPASTEQLVAAVNVIVRLTRGEAVSTPAGTIHLTYASPATGVPVLIAAAGPKMLRVASRVADGAVVPARLDEEFFAMNRREVALGLAEASRATAFRLVLWVPCSVALNRREAHEAVRAHVARILMRTPISVLAPEHRDKPRMVREQYDYYQHMVAGTHHGEPVPEALIDRFSIAGTPEDCHRQLERLVTLGARELVIVPHGLDHMARQQTLRLFANVAKRFDVEEHIHQPKLKNWGA